MLEQPKNPPNEKTAMLDLKSADTLRELASNKRAVTFGEVQIAMFSFLGLNFKFAIANKEDRIQREYLSGRFYELEELEIIRKAFNPGGVFVDIGSNVGNHSVFAGSFLHPDRIILFEPNPIAYNLLFANLKLNDLIEKVDLTWLGYGLSDAEINDASISSPQKNIGAARITESGGSIPLITGDQALESSFIDFLKIDVEGMELKVLAGLSKTIERCRPKLFIEVDDVNNDPFLCWLKSNDYIIQETIKRYATNKNYLISPKEA